jgi:hypothetical protein
MCFHGRVSGPRANPYRTGHGRPLESPNNSLMRNPQFATRSMGVAETSPSVPQRDDEGTYRQDGEHPSIASTWPRLGGSTHNYTYRKHTECRRMPNTCAWHHRYLLEYCRCQLKLTLRTPAQLAKKTLQEHPRSCKASGATPAGALTRPHGTTQCPGGKNVPSASASHRDPLNNQGKPTFFRK